MHGCPQGNVMILRANRTAARFFSYFSFRLSFFFFLPLTFVLRSFLSLVLFLPLPLPLFLFPLFSLFLRSSSRSRDKTAQVGSRDKEEKATACICVLEIILSRRIAIHAGFGCFSAPLSFFPAGIDRCVLVKVFPRAPKGEKKLSAYVMPCARTIPPFTVLSCTLSFIYYIFFYILLCRIQELIQEFFIYFNEFYWRMDT